MKKSINLRRVQIDYNFQDEKRKEKLIKVGSILEVNSGGKIEKFRVLRRYFKRNRLFVEKIKDSEL